MSLQVRYHQIELECPRCCWRQYVYPSPMPGKPEWLCVVAGCNCDRNEAVMVVLPHAPYVTKPPAPLTAAEMQKFFRDQELKEHREKAESLKTILDEVRSSLGCPDGKSITEWAAGIAKKAAAGGDA